jgi:hypothetical protein
VPAGNSRNGPRCRQKQRWWQTTTSPTKSSSVKPLACRASKQHLSTEAGRNSAHAFTGPPMPSAIARWSTRDALQKGCSFANLDAHVPATRHSIFQAGSIGKQFTAAAILLLEGHGKLHLDDRIARYLPLTQASWGSITLRRAPLPLNRACDCLAGRQEENGGDRLRAGLPCLPPDEVKARIKADMPKWAN